MVAKNKIGMLVTVLLIATMSLVASAQTVTYSPTVSLFTNGTQLTLSDYYTETSSNGNFSYNPVIVNASSVSGNTSTDFTYTVSPSISNGFVRIKNTTSISSPQTNLLFFGSSSLTYGGFLFPGEVAQFRAIGTALHLASSNGMSSANILWVPWP